MPLDITLRSLTAQPITADNFRPYGQVIFPTADGKRFDADDAQLHFKDGIPRFYLMQLPQRGRQFAHITRHQQCTQCLGALADKPWLLAVAPPGATNCPSPSEIQAFKIPGNCFVKLAIGTWHAGPYFDEATIDFYNLELSDTNLTDHDTCDLQAQYGLRFSIV
ncbi:ureidoglycolate lyase [Almyronema epifaneia]|uniref:Ureidoglycolate lyase n=1 Tax=Almyronema epifaneia S1 TaxID=2991925 RepID=A0ABW6IEX8_9CYAN